MLQQFFTPVKSSLKVLFTMLNKETVSVPSTCERNPYHHLFIHSISASLHMVSVEMKLSLYAS